MSAVALAAAPAGSVVMTTPRAPAVHCQVSGGDKLPASSGGAAALCRAIEQAIAAQPPGKPLRVAVRVLSPHELAATITTASGRVLPEQRLAIADRALTRGSLQRFARTIAAVARKESP